MNEQTIREATTSGYQFGSYQSESQIESVIRQNITDAMKLRGQQDANDSLMYTICRKTTEVLLRDYPSMTDAEFVIMLEAGVSGEFTKDTWVSGAIILQWLRMYNTHQSRLAVVDERTEEEKSINRKSKAEIDALNEEACNNKIHDAFDFYKEHGTIFDDSREPQGFATVQFAAVVYRWFRDKGKIPTPTDERLAEARKSAEDRANNKNIRKEFLQSANEDWESAYLLAKYFDDVMNHKL